jgi:hypothetical protein
MLIVVGVCCINSMRESGACCIEFQIEGYPTNFVTHGGYSA